MRAHKLVNYKSILQALGEAGCPICRFMKNFQTAFTVNTSRTPRDREFWDALRNSWFRSADYTHERGETCYPPAKL
jgi:hypothetical protein